MLKIHHHHATTHKFNHYLNTPSCFFHVGILSITAALGISSLGISSLLWELALWELALATLALKPRLGGDFSWSDVITHKGY